MNSTKQIKYVMINLVTGTNIRYNIVEK